MAAKAASAYRPDAARIAFPRPWRAVHDGKADRVRHRLPKCRSLNGIKRSKHFSLIGRGGSAWAFAFA
jgi:hypothetical protein